MKNHLVLSKWETASPDSVPSYDQLLGLVSKRLLPMNMAADSRSMHINRSKLLRIPSQQS